MRKRNLIYLAAVVVFAGLIPGLFPRCANIVPPSGGPRDTIPPRVVNSIPANFSTRFTGTEIEIEFDEFIQLRNINQQFIITPPQRERPDFRVRGRRLYIDLRTELIPNTTYTLNFGNAIADLNEGNPLVNYDFVFSTGDEIDSLGYSGLVLDAFTNEPVEGAVVMLYEELNDSVPFRRMPLYASRTGEDGRFRMNNLRADTFLVFALTDVNNNYLYDRPADESIAFLSDYLYLVPGWENVQSDTSATGVNNNAFAEINETGINDTVTVNIASEGIEQVLQVPVLNDTLYMFREDTGRQLLSRNERRQRGELLFVFRRPLEGEWSISPVGIDTPDDWKITEKNPAMDSIRFWITDSEIRNTNNLRFAVSYMATGPSDSLRQINDTVNMNYSPPSRARRQAGDQEEVPVLDVNFGIARGGNQDLNRGLKVSFPVPLADTDLSRAQLATINNEVAQRRIFEFIRDSVRIRDYRIITEWAPGSQYTFKAEPGTFTGIFGAENDSLEFGFQTRSADHYSIIELNLTGINGNMIIQLLDEKERKLKEFYPAADTLITIDYLQPARYSIKAIFDTNNNRKWDTGNYLKGIQPERVLFYDQPIATRSNWVTEIAWDLSRH